MVRTASTGAHVDRNGDVPGPSRLGRFVAAAGDYTWQLHPAVRREHTEGQIAKSIASQTAKLPSDTFLWAPITAIGASATLQMMGKQSASVFVGQWAPTLLILGLYNKLVKQHGSDFTDPRA